MHYTVNCEREHTRDIQKSAANRVAGRNVNERMQEKKIRNKRTQWRAKKQAHGPNKYEHRVDVDVDVNVLRLCWNVTLLCTLNSLFRYFCVVSKNRKRSKFESFFFFFLRSCLLKVIGY